VFYIFRTSRDPEELARVAELVIKTTGITGVKAFKIAALALEYTKPDYGFWNNNT